MIHGYLSSHIKEQIERALYLKSLIPRTIYPELASLADRCSRILEENINYLRLLLRILKDSEGEDIRDLYRSFRVAYREIETVEYFGIPALHFQTNSSKFLNKLIFGIQNEINLPFIAPSVACFSNGYYWIHGTTNVMFMPIGEPNSLLQLPDVFHELGHCVLFKKDNDLRLGEVKIAYSEIIGRITSHFEILRDKKRKSTAPSELPMIIRHLHSQWKYWASEFFSDLFACYTVGPAYAWAHLHLTTKKSDDIYRFEKPPLVQTHPSDDSRMKILEIGLKKIGFEDDAKTIRSVWDSMLFVTSSTPIHEYQYAYPTSLMEAFADLVLRGVEGSKIRVITPEKLEMLDENSIRKIFNDSWKMFWTQPNYLEWEKSKLNSLNQLYT
jgi:hypothetical protein